MTVVVVVEVVTVVVVAVVLVVVGGAVEVVVKLHGGFGYMKESPARRAFVDTRPVSIGGGGDEVMIQYLAKMLGF